MYLDTRDMLNVYVWVSRMRSSSSQILPTGVVSWFGGFVGMLNVISRSSCVREKMFGVGSNCLAPCELSLHPPLCGLPADVRISSQILPTGVVSWSGGFVGVLYVISTSSCVREKMFGVGSNCLAPRELPLHPPLCGLPADVRSMTRRRPISDGF